jgi:ATP-dependent Clp protease protease subunit
MAQSPFVYIPYVIQDTPQGRTTMDLHSRLLKDRTVLLTGPIDDHLAHSIVAQLFYLESEDPERDVFLYINSPGGIVTSGLAIYDAMQFVRCEVATVCLGQAASMAAFLLAAGAPGKRMAMPSARIMIHQPLGGAQGQATDMAIHVQEILRMKAHLNRILAERTAKPLEVIERDTERDFFLGAEEARAYGVVDRVVAPRTRA